MKYQFGYGSVTRNCRSRSARPGAYTARKRYGKSACPSRIARTEMPVDLIAGEGATNRQSEEAADGGEADYRRAYCADEGCADPACPPCTRAKHECCECEAR